jgi:hypothetical protein
MFKIEIDLFQVSSRFAKIIGLENEFFEKYTTDFLIMNFDIKQRLLNIKNTEVSEKLVTYIASLKERFLNEAILKLKQFASRCFADTNFK